MLSNVSFSLPAEGKGPTEVEKKTEPLERAFKPMPFLSKFWEIQVGPDSVKYVLFSYRLATTTNVIAHASLKPTAYFLFLVLT